MPPPVALTTLGWLKWVGDPAWPYFEHWYLKFLHKTLTDHWPKISGGVDKEALQLRLDICRVLELDRKAKLDLMLLAHSGVVGRTCANKILWDMCSSWALSQTYEDLSHKCTSQVGWIRRTFDRPPAGHSDLCWWTWEALGEPWDRHERFDPRKVPDKVPKVSLGPGRVPQAPPACWQET